MLTPFLVLCLFAIVVTVSCASVVRMDARGQTHREPAHNLAQRLQPMVLYGVATSVDIKDLRARLQSQVETWAAKPIKEGRFLAIVGEAPPGMENNESVTPLPTGIVKRVPCDDGYSGILCKESYAMELGYNHSADWFVRVDDDNYVNTTGLEDYLRSLHVDPDEPTLVAQSGCGLNVKSLEHVCPGVAKFGGFCGGSGYALNRAALLAMRAGNWAHLREEYQNLGNRSVGYGDMATSCILRQRGSISWHQAENVQGNRFMTVDAWKGLVRSRPMTYHYATPDVMRWLHAKLHASETSIGEVIPRPLARILGVDNSAQDQIAALEKKAFDENGCCCWFGFERLREQCADGSLVQVDFERTRFMSTQSQISPMNAQ